MYGDKEKKISRAEGIELVKKYDGKYPSSYLGKDLEKIISEIEIDLNKFNEICDQFTNKKLFKLDNQKTS